MNFFSLYRDYPLSVLRDGNEYMQVVFRTDKEGNNITIPGGMNLDVVNNSTSDGNTHCVDYVRTTRPNTFVSINNGTFESSIAYSNLNAFSIGKDDTFDFYIVGYGNIYKCINGNFVTLVELRNTSKIINDIVRPEHKYTIAINKCTIGDTKFSNFLTKYYFNLILRTPLEINNNEHTLRNLNNVDIMYVNNDAMLSKVLHNEVSNENVTINDTIIDAVINLTL